jgi:hypothetical protein
MGYNMLAGSETQRICNACNIMLNKQQSFRSDLYGTGTSAEQIASYLLLNV